MAKPLKTIRFTIRGFRWTAQIFTPEDYLEIEKQHETEESDAMTLRDKQLLLFKSTAIDRVTVRHEMVHAFICTLHLSSVDLDGEQMEEIFAEFISTSIEEYIRVSDSLFKRIKSFSEKLNVRKTKKTQAVAGTSGASTV